LGLVGWRGYPRRIRQAGYADAVMPPSTEQLC